MKIIEPRDAVWVRFGECPAIPMLLAPEFDTSSLEVVGIIDCSSMPVPNSYRDGEYFEEGGKVTALDREIHLVNLLTGKDDVWQGGKNIRHSTIGDELGVIDLTKTGGFVATEKLQSAIRGLPKEAPGLAPLLDHWD